jgi:RimJ/RimL family protein N-acetyltransferase
MTEVRLEPWGSEGLPLMRRLLGDPRMTEHLGGPESEAKIAERQARYEKPDSRQYKVVVGDPPEDAGAVGYWEKEWRGTTVWEVGWLVLPEQQGKGIATAAMRQLLDIMRLDPVAHRDVHAYPSVDNAASNSICRKLGFTLLEAIDFEYPPRSGHLLRCNDWRLDLGAAGPANLALDDVPGVRTGKSEEAAP